MELKFNRIILYNQGINRSNRTFMELKCQIRINLWINIEF